MRDIRLLRRVAGCLAVVVLLLGLLLVIIWGRQGSSAGQIDDPAPGDRVVARIGEREFTLSVLEERLMESYGREMINLLLDREALRLEAQEKDIMITRIQVDEELMRMQQGYDSETQFYEAMKNIGLSEEDVREDVYYKLMLEEITTRDIHISDSQVTRYIHENPEEFVARTMLRMQKIIAATEEDAWLILSLYQSGSSFESLAMEKSIDPFTAPDGGDLGWIDRTDPFVPHEILEAADDMEIGSVTGPILTAEGYTMIRLLDRRVESERTMEQIREDVRKMLSLQSAPPMQEVIRSLREKFNGVILDPELQ